MVSDTRPTSTRWASPRRAGISMSSSIALPPPGVRSSSPTGANLWW